MNLVPSPSASSLAEVLALNPASLQPDTRTHTPSPKQLLFRVGCYVKVSWLVVVASEKSEIYPEWELVLLPITCRLCLWSILSAKWNHASNIFWAKTGIYHTKTYINNIKHLCNSSANYLAKKPWPEISSGSWSHRWPERLGGLRVKIIWLKYWLQNHFSEPGVCERLFSPHALKSNGCGTWLGVSWNIKFYHKFNTTQWSTHSLICVYIFIEGIYIKTGFNLVVIKDKVKLGRGPTGFQKLQKSMSMFKNFL